MALLPRLVRIPRLTRRHRPRLVFAIFGGISAAVSIGLLALAAAWAHQPLLVPSLGPTAFLIFERPRLAAAAPRNILLGHGLGIAVGELAFRVSGAPAGRALDHLTFAAALAGALSVSVVMAVMVLIAVPHPPAAATALIVSLGVLTSWKDVVALAVAVALLAAQGLAIDRLVGLTYPAWVPEPMHRSWWATRPGGGVGAPDGPGGPGGPARP